MNVRYLVGSANERECTQIKEQVHGPETAVLPPTG